MTRRRKGGSDSHFYYKWLDKALCDLQCARLLLTYGGDAYNIAFHCQQAIEKALKGYLLYRTGRHFDGHNLTYLCRQAIRLDPDGFSEYLDESAALNDLYIETRYPTDLPFEINEVEIRRYLDHGRAHVRGDPPPALRRRPPPPRRGRGSINISTPGGSCP